MIRRRFCYNFGMLIKQILVVIVMWCVFAKPVHAYLDPGSGSYLIQILIASLVGGGLFVKTFWARMKGFLAKKKNEKKGE